MLEKNNDFFTKYNLNKSEAFNGRISTLSGSLGNAPIIINPQTLNSNLFLNILKFNKVIPHINNYSGVTKNYLYIYMDPRHPAKNSKEYYYKIPKDKQKLFGVAEIVFGYEPIYLGKGVSSTGHRFAQHIAEFINKEKKEKANKTKQNKFQEIEDYFPKSSIVRNWNEYRESFVKIIFEFESRNELEEAEKILIKLIGSINGSNKGPLVNILDTK